MSNSVKITIAIVVAVLVIASIVGLIFVLTPASKPNNSLTQRLATPENVRINEENWVLSFDSVENAQGYRIYINDADTFVSTSTSVSVQSYITRYAKYSFEVSAIHSTPDYNSARSAPVYGYNTTTLSTPLNLTWEGEELSWLAVENASSYSVMLTYKPDGSNNEMTTNILTHGNTFDFGALLTQAPYSQINFFELAVKASSTDAYGNENDYIYDSAYSDPAIYFRTTSIDAPTIRISPDVRGQTSQQGTERVLSWDVDFAVDKYLVYVNGQLRKTVANDELEGLSSYSLNLNEIMVDGVCITDTLGAKTIFVTAVPKTNDYYHIENRSSDLIEYTVVHTLSAPDAQSIKMSKEGENLVITWDTVEDTYGVNTRYTPTSYNLVLLANSDIENPTFVARAPVTELLLPYYSIPLSELGALGVSFKAMISAVESKSEYILDSAYSEESEAYEAITQLETPDGFALNESNGVDTLSWRAVDNAGSYTVMVYMGTIDAETNNINAIGSALVTQVVTETKITISNYMKAHLPNPLGPGLYAIRVIANGASKFYTSSNACEPVKYDYKVRLTAPVIHSVSKVAQLDNKGEITFVFDYVEGAERYHINVNGILAFLIDQPALDSEMISSVEVNGATSYRIVDKTRLTDFINNNYSSPKVHSITVQAIILDTENANGYISSLLSTEYKFSDYYTHQKPTNLVASQQAGQNGVVLTWDSVPTVVAANGTYEIFVIDENNGRVAVNTNAITGSRVADLSPYLQLGMNTIEMRSARSGLYLASDYVTTTINYVYNLSGTLNTTITPISGSKNNRLFIEASKNVDFRYITDYYVEFINSAGTVFNSLNIHTDVAGSDIDEVITDEYLPLYKTTTVKIYAGKTKSGDNIISQSVHLNSDGCEWSLDYESSSFMDSPTISHSETVVDSKPKVYATINVSKDSLPFTKSIEWTFEGTTGITYTSYIDITDTTTNSFTIDLTALQLVNDDENALLGGGYNITATAISNKSSELRSSPAQYAFDIIIDLQAPVGFVMADDHSYLQWNYIAFVDHYEITMNGATKSTTVSEYTDYVDGRYVRVMRANTTGWFSGLSKGASVVFGVKAVAQANGYYRDSSAVYTWEFNNRISAPLVEVVTKNNQLHLQILYSKLVSNYSISCEESSAGVSVNATANIVENGYVYFNLENVLADKVAGEYGFSVVANPLDASTYNTSDPTVVNVEWQKRFAQPNITVVQNFDNNTLSFTWSDVSVDVLTNGQLTRVAPSGYLVTITQASRTDSVYSQTLTTNTLTLTSTELASMTSGYYFVSVTALENAPMLESYESAYRFAYQQQLQTPIIAFVAGDSLANENTLDVQQTSTPDANAPKFDLKVINSANEEKIFEGIAWSGNVATLQGGTHFAERGSYTIAIRNAQNGSLAASAWSNSLVIRYGTSFDVAENITMAYDDPTTTYTVNFDKLELPSELTGEVTYTASVTYNNIKQDITSDQITLVADSTYSFSFQNAQWGDAWAEGSRFTIVITANTTDELYTTSSTTYVFAIGDMVAPYDIVFTADGADATITWKGDTQYVGVVYTYSIYVVDENGSNLYLASDGSWTADNANQATLTTTTTEIAFTLPSAQVYAIYFTIIASGTNGVDPVTSATHTHIFMNTQTLAGVNDFAVNYDKTTQTYTAIWTNNLQNSTAFNGGAYTLKINGTTVLNSSVESGSIVSVDITSFVPTFLASGRIVYWEITASDVVYTVGESNYIAYKGGVYANSLELPIVISDAPNTLVLDGTVAKWSYVVNATKYKLYIADSTGTPLNFENGSAREIVTNQNTYDFSGLLAGLEAGDYLVVVQVEEDEANGVYVSEDLEKTTATYLQTAPLNAITDLTFEQNYVGGQVRTYARWNYNTNGDFTIENMKFSIAITDKNGKSVAYDNLNPALSGTKFTYSNSAGDTTKGSFVFSYIDRSADDLTVDLAGGECVFTVVVSGVDGSAYFTASNGVSGNFNNIFGLQAITNDNLFAVAPECFIKGVAYNEIAGYEEGLRDDFEEYESTIGFNEKYLIITDDTLSFAQYFKVYISTTTDGNGANIYEYVGDIKNEATEISFDAISNTTAKLRLPTAIAGINKIKLIPYGEEEYYKYIDGGTVYDLSSAVAIEKISSEFDVELFMRNEAPNLNIHSIKLGYSDSQDKKNINSVNLTFSNLKIGGIYRVTPYYYDYYNNGALVECEPTDIGPLTADDFNGSVPKGLDIYDLISFYGPHQFYFMVQSIVPQGEGSNYWLNSHISTTPNSFEFVTKLMEFAPILDGDSSVNSLVNPITVKNAGGTLENGDLYWTLPTHPYSVRIIYTVTMCDENQTLGSIMQFGEKHIIKYSVVLDVIVTKDSITYQIGEQSMLKQNVTSTITDGFVLDTENGILVFDMTKYFEDSTRVADNQNGAWYLAGSYTYMITADVFAISEPYNCTRISSPASFGTESAMNKYNYTNIPFPYQPTNVRLSENGDLTWDYADKIYDSAYLDTAIFEIWVYNWDDAHENYTISKLDDYVYGTVVTNISHLLTAGGAKRNEIVIRTVSPDINIYEPSEWVSVNAGALPTTTALPNISVVWGNDETLKNNDHRVVAITLDNYVSNAILADVEANNFDVHINVHLLKVIDWAQGSPEPTYANYDEARESGDYPTISWNQPLTEQYYNYITYKNHEGLDYKFNFVNAINALVSAGLESETLWLIGGDSLAGGYYYLKVELTTGLTCYSPSVVYQSKLVREVWRSSQEQATITGQHLTTKTLGVAAEPVNGNDREWGADAHKEALLTIPVDTIDYRIDENTIAPKLPSEITVYARLYTGVGYDADHSYSITYSIPDVSLITGGKYQNGDITLSMITDNDYSRINVTIDIHALFDKNIYAGVYDIFWVLNGDQVGDSSPVEAPYQLREEICHYVVFPTPILDYRLGYTGTNSDQYVINWVLTPNKYTHEVNDTIDYNINLYAFVADENGNFATDDAEANDPNFLKASSQEKYFVGNANASGTTLENYSNIQVLNGRDCYIQQNTIAGFSLTPNKTYKVYMYLSTSRWGETDDMNAFYYLNSDTSVGVEYVYKKISGQHVADDVESPTADYPLERFTASDREVVENGAYYTFTSTQPDYNNNALELFVYNTQDPRAGYDEHWTDAQENDGTYLAHFIIGTKDNVSAKNGRQDLYILYDYEDKVVNSGTWNYSRSVGFMSGKNITINKLTISELLYNKVTQVAGLDLNKMWTPITYYCKIQSWINNNEVNKNMPTYLGTDNVVRYKDKDTVFGREWIKKHIDFVRNEDGSINSEAVEKLYNDLLEDNKVFDVPYLNANALNLEYYFTFQHTIQYAMPYLSSENGIEIVNKDGTSDYVDYSTIDLGNGVLQYKTDGYVKATSNFNYYYRIWLNDLYTTDPLIRSDKEINVTVSATFYDDTTGGSGNYGDYNNSQWGTFDSVNLFVHYVDEDNEGLSAEFIAAHKGQAYIELKFDSPESGASALYTAMDQWLPNIFTFEFRAVTSGSPVINTGETNTTNAFVTYNNVTGEVNSTKNVISRIYAESNSSEHPNYLTVRKQYTAPTVDLRFDSMQTSLSEFGEMQSIKLGETYYTTNLVEELTNSDYVGLASNPYLFSTAEALDRTGGQAFEYGMLKTDKRTHYEIKLYYKDDNGNILNTSNVISLLTNDVNNTLTRFTQAVNGLDVDSARFDYSKYKDIYPYEETCLYEAMYSLINGDLKTGAYKGGRIDIDIRVVTPSEDRTDKNNQNWVTSAWASAERAELYTFYFHPRLETVVTSFNQNECNFTTDYEGGTSSFYVQDGKYYYHQSYIPLHYTSISRTAQYYVYLSRTQGGSGYINMPYNINNSVVRDYCTLSPRNTDTKNTKNLVDILKHDLVDAKTYDSSSSSAHANQWRLPENVNDTWLINIVAAVGDDMTYVGRGFNSKDQNYTVKLKIKMDIQSLSIDMEPLVNKSTNVLNENSFTATTLKNGYAGSALWKNYSTSQDLTGQAFNRAANKAVFKYYYPYGNTMKATGTYTIGDTDNRYYKLFYDFIKGSLMSDLNIRASDGFRVNVMFKFNDGTYASENVVDSAYSVDLYLNYYRNLPFDTSKIVFTQDSSGIKMNANYSVHNQFAALNVTIDQYDYSNGNNYTSTAIYTSNSTSGSTKNYVAKASFDYDYADCFSTKSIPADVIRKMINNGYTQYTGYAQGGMNYFTITPVHDGYAKDHNLLAYGTKYNDDVDYTVRINPTVSISYDEGMHNDENTVISDSWIWDHSSTTNSYIEKELIMDEYWGYIENITADYSYMNGATVEVYYAYGLTIENPAHVVDIVSGTSTKAMTSFGSGQYNDVEIEIHVYCKEGFESVFAHSSDSDSIDIKPGSDVQEYVPVRKDYSEKTNILSYVELEVTDGWMGGGSVADYVGSIFKGGNRDARCTVSYDTSELPSGFSFNIDVSARYRVSYSENVAEEGEEENIKTIYRTGNLSGNTTISTGGSGSFRLTGHYWETDAYKCLASLSDFEGGSASMSNSTFERGSGATAGATTPCVTCGGDGKVESAHKGSKVITITDTYYKCSCGETIDGTIWDGDTKTWGTGCPKHLADCSSCNGTGYI